MKSQIQASLKSSPALSTTLKPVKSKPFKRKHNKRFCSA